MCVCARVCIYIYIYLCVHIYVCVHTYIYIYICMCMCVCVCVRACIIRKYSWPSGMLVHCTISLDAMHGIASRARNVRARNVRARNVKARNVKARNVRGPRECYCIALYHLIALYHHTLSSHCKQNTAVSVSFCMYVCVCCGGCHVCVWVCL